MMSKALVPLGKGRMFCWGCRHEVNPRRPYVGIRLRKGIMRVWHPDCAPRSTMAQAQSNACKMNPLTRDETTNVKKVQAIALDDSKRLLGRDPHSHLGHAARGEHYAYGKVVDWYGAKQNACKTNPSNMCARCGFSIVGKPQTIINGKDYCRTCAIIIKSIKKNPKLKGYKSNDGDWIRKGIMYKGPLVPGGAGGVDFRVVMWGAKRHGDKMEYGTHHMFFPTTGEPYFAYGHYFGPKMQSALADFNKRVREYKSNPKRAQENPWKFKVGETVQIKSSKWVPKIWRGKMVKIIGTHTTTTRAGFKNPWYTVKDLQTGRISKSFDSTNLERVGEKNPWHHAGTFRSSREARRLAKSFSIESFPTRLTKAGGRGIGVEYYTQPETPTPYTPEWFEYMEKVKSGELTEKLGPEAITSAPVRYGVGTARARPRRERALFRQMFPFETYPFGKGKGKANPKKKSKKNPYLVRGFRGRPKWRPMTNPKSPHPSYYNEKVKKEALKWAKKLKLRPEAIGGTPLDWWYFIVGCEKQYRKNPYLVRGVRKGRYMEKPIRSRKAARRALGRLGRHSQKIKITEHEYRRISGWGGHGPRPLRRWRPVGKVMLTPGTYKVPRLKRGKYKNNPHLIGMAKKEKDAEKIAYDYMRKTKKPAGLVFSGRQRIRAGSAFRHLNRPAMWEVVTFDKGQKLTGIPRGMRKGMRRPVKHSPIGDWFWKHNPRRGEKTARKLWGKAGWWWHTSTPKQKEEWLRNVFPKMKASTRKMWIRKDWGKIDIHGAPTLGGISMGKVLRYSRQYGAKKTRKFYEEVASMRMSKKVHAGRTLSGHRLPYLPKNRKRGSDYEKIFGPFRSRKKVKRYRLNAPLKTRKLYCPTCNRIVNAKRWGQPGMVGPFYQCPKCKRKHLSMRSRPKRGRYSPKYEMRLRALTKRQVKALKRGRKYRRNIAPLVAAAALSAAPVVMKEGGKLVKRLTKKKNPKRLHPAYSRMQRGLRAKYLRPGERSLLKQVAKRNPKRKKRMARIPRARKMAAHEIEGSLKYAAISRRLPKGRGGRTFRSMAKQEMGHANKIVAMRKKGYIQNRRPSTARREELQSKLSKLKRGQNVRPPKEWWAGKGKKRGMLRKISTSKKYRRRSHTAKARITAGIWHKGYSRGAKIRTVQKIMSGRGGIPNPPMTRRELILKAQEAEYKYEATGDRHYKMVAMQLRDELKATAHQRTPSIPPKHYPKPTYDRCNQGHPLQEVYDERYNEYRWDCLLCMSRMQRNPLGPTMRRIPRGIAKHVRRVARTRRPIVRGKNYFTPARGGVQVFRGKKASFVEV